MVETLANESNRKEPQEDFGLPSRSLKKKHTGSRMSFPFARSISHEQEKALNRPAASSNITVSPSLDKSISTICQGAKPRVSSQSEDRDSLANTENLRNSGCCMPSTFYTGGLSTKLITKTGIGGDVEIEATTSPETKPKPFLRASPLSKSDSLVSFGPTSVVNIGNNNLTITDVSMQTRTMDNLQSRKNILGMAHKFESTELSPNLETSNLLSNQHARSRLFYPRNRPEESGVPECENFVSNKSIKKVEDVMLKPYSGNSSSLASSHNGKSLSAFVLRTNNIGAIEKSKPPPSESRPEPNSKFKSRTQDQTVIPQGQTSGRNTAGPITDNYRTRDELGGFLSKNILEMAQKLEYKETSTNFETSNPLGKLPARSRLSYPLNRSVSRSVSSDCGPNQPIKDVGNTKLLIKTNTGNADEIKRLPPLTRPKPLITSKLQAKDEPIISLDCTSSSLPADSNNQESDLGEVRSRKNILEIAHLFENKDTTNLDVTNDMRNLHSRSRLSFPFNTEPIEAVAKPRGVSSSELRLSGEGSSTNQQSEKRFGNENEIQPLAVDTKPKPGMKLKPETNNETVISSAYTYKGDVGSSVSDDSIQGNELVDMHSIKHYIRDMAHKYKSKTSSTDSEGLNKHGSDFGRNQAVKVVDDTLTKGQKGVSALKTTRGYIQQAKKPVIRQLGFDKVDIAGSKANGLLTSSSNTAQKNPGKKLIRDFFRSTKDILPSKTKVYRMYRHIGGVNVASVPRQEEGTPVLVSVKDLVNLQARSRLSYSPPRVSESDATHRTFASPASQRSYTFEDLGNLQDIMVDNCIYGDWSAEKPPNNPAQVNLYENVTGRRVTASHGLNRGGELKYENWARPAQVGHEPQFQSESKLMDHIYTYGNYQSSDMKNLSSRKKELDKDLIFAQMVQRSSDLDQLKTTSLPYPKRFYRQYSEPKQVNKSTPPYHESVRSQFPLIKDDISHWAHTHADYPEYNVYEEIDDVVRPDDFDGSQGSPHVASQQLYSNLPGNRWSLPVGLSPYYTTQLNEFQNPTNSSPNRSVGMRSSRTVGSSVSCDLNRVSNVGIESSVSLESMVGMQDSLSDDSFSSCSGSSFESIDESNFCEGQNPSVSSSTLEWMDRLLPGPDNSSPLWCNMPEVHALGILQHMSQKERKLQQSLFEIVTSEASYLKSLFVFSGLFINHAAFRGAASVIKEAEKKELFSNISSIMEVSTRFAHELENAWRNNPRLSDEICEIIVRYAETDFKAYLIYCTNFVFQERKLAALRNTNHRFKQLTAEFESRPECQPVNSYLAIPLQRIARMALLVETVSKSMDNDCHGYEVAKRALNQLHKLLKVCDDRAGQVKDIEDNLKIDKELDFKKLKKTPIVSISRKLLKSGKLTRILLSNKSKSPSNKKKESLSLFLFDDLLVIARKSPFGKKTKKEVIDYAGRDALKAIPITETTLTTWLPKGVAGGGKFLFLLILFCNHMNQWADFCFACDTPIQQMGWVEAITPVSEQSNRQMEQVLTVGIDLNPEWESHV